MDAKSQSIVAFLQSCGEAAPSLAPNYARMEELYKRKLWHQLTVLLEEHLGEEAAAAQLGGLYETFVSDFKHKLNKLALARIQVAVALNKCADADEVSAFAEAALADHAGELESGAFVLCELSRMLLRFGKQEAAKEKLDAAAAKIEGAAGVTPEVQAAFYRARAGYYKVLGPAAEFYRAALLLLAYAPLSSMPSSEALEISFDLGIAALVGEKLYNFGELLEHPVVATLEQTQYAWLAQLLRAFNAGDIEQYEALVAREHMQLEAQPALLSNTLFLKEKITLMCLTQTLFQRTGPGADRIVPFAHIATAAKLRMEEVEICLMRALSLGIIRGVIDQVNQTLRVTWVQPRVLQQPQIATMAERLQSWASTVSSTLTELDALTPEFAA
mmetsp:Transcript_30793/g.100576  ORF Transcript_30793/g.100576 Transcript_30793/m.100576 type:complete len:387 (-) Transcript_30793:95-1255(-)